MEEIIALIEKYDLPPHYHPENAVPPQKLQHEGKNHMYDMMDKMADKATICDAQLVNLTVNRLMDNPDEKLKLVDANGQTIWERGVELAAELVPPELNPTASEMTYFPPEHPPVSDQYTANKFADLLQNLMQEHVGYVADANAKRSFRHIYPRRLWSADTLIVTGSQLRDASGMKLLNNATIHINLPNANFEQIELLIAVLNYYIEALRYINIQISPDLLQRYTGRVSSLESLQRRVESQVMEMMKDYIVKCRKIPDVTYIMTPPIGLAQKHPERAIISRMFEHATVLMNQQHPNSRIALLGYGIRILDHSRHPEPHSLPRYFAELETFINHQFPSRRTSLLVDAQRVIQQDELCTRFLRNPAVPARFTTAWGDFVRDEVYKMNLPQEYIASSFVNSQAFKDTSKDGEVKTAMKTAALVQFPSKQPKLPEARYHSDFRNPSKYEKQVGPGIKSLLQSMAKQVEQAMASESAVISTTEFEEAVNITPRQLSLKDPDFDLQALHDEMIPNWHSPDLTAVNYDIPKKVKANYQDNLEQIRAFDILAIAMAFGYELFHKGPEAIRKYINAEVIRDKTVRDAWLEEVKDAANVNTSKAKRSRQARPPPTRPLPKLYDPILTIYAMASKPERVLRLINSQSKVKTQTKQIGVYLLANILNRRRVDKVPYPTPHQLACEIGIPHQVIQQHLYHVSKTLWRQLGDVPIQTPAMLYYKYPMVSKLTIVRNRQQIAHREWEYTDNMSATGMHLDIIDLKECREVFAAHTENQRGEEYPSVEIDTKYHCVPDVVGDNPDLNPEPLNKKLLHQIAEELKLICPEYNTIKNPFPEPASISQHPLRARLRLIKKGEGSRAPAPRTWNVNYFEKLKLWDNKSTIIEEPPRQITSSTSKSKSVSRASPASDISTEYDNDKTIIRDNTTFSDTDESESEAELVTHRINPRLKSVVIEVVKTSTPKKTTTTTSQHANKSRKTNNPDAEHTMDTSRTSTTSQRSSGPSRKRTNSQREVTSRPQSPTPEASGTEQNNTQPHFNANLESMLGEPNVTLSSSREETNSQPNVVQGDATVTCSATNASVSRQTNETTETSKGDNTVTFTPSTSQMSQNPPTDQQSLSKPVEKPQNSLLNGDTRNVQADGNKTTESNSGSAPTEATTKQTPIEFDDPVTTNYWDDNHVCNDRMSTRGNSPRPIVERLLPMDPGTFLKPNPIPPNPNMYPDHRPTTSADVAGIFTMQPPAFNTDKNAPMFEEVSLSPQLRLKVRTHEDLPDHPPTIINKEILISKSVVRQVLQTASDTAQRQMDESRDIIPESDQYAYVAEAHEKQRAKQQKVLDAQKKKAEKDEAHFELEAGVMLYMPPDQKDWLKSLLYHKNKVIEQQSGKMLFQRQKPFLNRIQALSFLVFETRATYRQRREFLESSCEKIKRIVKAVMLLEGSKANKQPPGELGRMETVSRFHSTDSAIEKWMHSQLIFAFLNLNLEHDDPKSDETLERAFQHIHNPEGVPIQITHENQWWDTTNQTPLEFSRAAPPYSKPAWVTLGYAKMILWKVSKECKVPKQAATITLMLDKIREGLEMQRTVHIEQSNLWKWTTLFIEACRVVNKAEKLPNWIVLDVYGIPRCTLPIVMTKPYSTTWKPRGSQGPFSLKLLSIGNYTLPNPDRRKTPRLHQKNSEEETDSEEVIASKKPNPLETDYVNPNDVTDDTIVPPQPASPYATERSSSLNQTFTVLDSSDASIDKNDERSMEDARNAVQAVFGGATRVNTRTRAGKMQIKVEVPNLTQRNSKETEQSLMVTSNEAIQQQEAGRDASNPVIENGGDDEPHQSERGDDAAQIGDQQLSQEAPDMSLQTTNPDSEHMQVTDESNEPPSTQAQMEIEPDAIHASIEVRHPDAAETLQNDATDMELAHQSVLSAQSTDQDSSDTCESASLAQLSQQTPMTTRERALMTRIIASKRRSPASNVSSKTRAQENLFECLTRERGITPLKLEKIHHDGPVENMAQLPDANADCEPPHFLPAVNNKFIENYLPRKYKEQGPKLILTMPNNMIKKRWETGYAGAANLLYNNWNAYIEVEDALQDSDNFNPEWNPKILRITRRQYVWILQALGIRDQTDENEVEQNIAEFITIGSYVNDFARKFGTRPEVRKWLQMVIPVDMLHEADLQRVKKHWTLLQSMPFKGSSTKTDAEFAQVLNKRQRCFIEIWRRSLRLQDVIDPFDTQELSAVNYHAPPTRSTSAYPSVMDDSLAHGGWIEVTPRSAIMRAAMRQGVCVRILDVMKTRVPTAKEVTQKDSTGKREVPYSLFENVPNVTMEFTTGSPLFNMPTRLEMIYYSTCNSAVTDYMSEEEPQLFQHRTPFSRGTKCEETINWYQRMAEYNQVDILETEATCLTCGVESTPLNPHLHDGCSKDVKLSKPRGESQLQEIYQEIMEMTEASMNVDTRIRQRPEINNLEQLPLVMNKSLRQQSRFLSSTLSALTLESIIEGEHPSAKHAVVLSCIAWDAQLKWHERKRREDIEELRRMMNLRNFASSIVTGEKVKEFVFDQPVTMPIHIVMTELNGVEKLNKKYKIPYPFWPEAVCKDSSDSLYDLGTVAPELLTPSLKSYKTNLINFPKDSEMYPETLKPGPLADDQDSELAADLLLTSSQLLGAHASPYSTLRSRELECACSVRNIYHMDEGESTVYFVWNWDSVKCLPMPRNEGVIIEISSMLPLKWAMQFPVSYRHGEQPTCDEIDVAMMEDHAGYDAITAYEVLKAPSQSALKRLLVSQSEPSCYNHILREILTAINQLFTRHNVFSLYTIDYGTFQEFQRCYQKSYFRSVAGLMPNHDIDMDQRPGRSYKQAMFDEFADRNLLHAFHLYYCLDAVEQKDMKQWEADAIETQIVRRGRKGNYGLKKKQRDQKANERLKTAGKLDDDQQKFGSAKRLAMQKQKKSTQPTNATRQGVPVLSVKRTLETNKTSSN